ncbi:tetratricopeptide repeat protein [Candidatus Woesearchaeota archaeon]|nr:tetratricopeptide repeat protein [Candidatus Woesearchaeota archaeon]
MASYCFYLRLSCVVFALLFALSISLMSALSAMAAPSEQPTQTTANIFEEAEELFFSGHFEAALQKYNSILNQFPSYNRMDAVLYKMAMTQLRLDKYDEAIATFDRLIKDHSQSTFLSSARQNKDIINNLIMNKDQFIADQLRKSGATEEAVKTLTNIPINIARENLTPGPQKDAAQTPLSAVQQTAVPQGTKNQIYIVLMAALVFFFVYLVIYYYKRPHLHLLRRKHH